MPALGDLPTPGFAGLPDYLSLMHDCWAQEPATRPTFAVVISRLRAMLADEAAAHRLARGDSPTRRSAASLVDSGSPLLSASAVALGGVPPPPPVKLERVVSDSSPVVGAP